MNAEGNILIPTLTTSETQRLRSDYPSIEHLEAGNVAAWLVERQEQLLVRAKDERTGMNLAKLLTLAGGAVGTICYATSPLAPIGALIAGVGYVWAVAQDLNDSHQFAPVPFVRGNFVEFLSAMGDSNAREEWFGNSNELVDLMFHLDPFERYELCMLKEHAHVLSEYLTQVESGKRFYAYRWLYDWFVNLKGTFPSREQLTSHLTHVTPDPRIDSRIVEAIREAQTPQRSCLGIPPTPVAELPQTPIATLPQTRTVNFNEERETETLAGETPAVEVKAQNITVNFFDFTRLRTEPDKFAHLRLIGGTGVGKTTFVDWLLDTLGGDRFVITPKKKSWNWVGLKVYGLWFDYATIRAKLRWIHAEMYRRYPLMAAGQTFEITNFVVDEWRLINTNVKAIKERDPETKQTIEIAPSAKAMMKDIITVARESALRLIALAQGENVASWGFEGESDLEECFTDIRLGEFAINYAKSLRNQCRKDSDDYEYWTAVLSELERQNQQRTREGKSIPCCMVGKFPAQMPDLTDWKRNVSDSDYDETFSTKLIETNPSTPPSEEATQAVRKAPPEDAEEGWKADGILMETFLARIESASSEASSSASIPLFDGLERDGKLLMLRLLLVKNLGKEKTILLAWGLKSGGRSHDKYKLASQLLDAMIGELSELGFKEENNWGVAKESES
ncbi:hypothetical protein H6F96_10080 [Microcoleus sp. FACHB-53]|nr:hypothetical protein [Microcoleus sp. FACHB-53]